MIFIPLEELSAKNKTDLLAFLLEHEKLGVGLSSLVKKHKKNIFAVYVQEVSAKNLYGLFSLDLTLLFILPFISSQAESALQKDFCSSFEEFFFQEKFEFPKCISGEENGVLAFVNIFENHKKKIIQLNHYDLMILNKQNFLSVLHKKIAKIERNDYKVLRCSTSLSEKDWHSALELQRLYEKEEVLIKKADLDFNEVLCNLKFSKASKNQYILILKAGDKIVSKAGTNAIGYLHVQLGGVFTEKSCRNRGYSSYLLSVLLAKLLKFSKTPVLFVKKENFPAQNLYSSLGFSKIASWAIAYFF